MKRILIRLSWLLGVLSLVVFTLGVTTLSSLAAPDIAISLTGANPTYTQDFSTLASTGTSSTVPSGWAFVEGGGSANSLYNTGTGSSTTGDTYSFGSTGAADRAFGGLRSGNVIPMLGANFNNGTGTSISALTITYTGEMWRLGATGRTDRLDFQYSTDAISVTSGTWIDVDALDFVSPVTTSAGAKDGNIAANRTQIVASINGLSLQSGTDFWIRWTDFDPSGADDGLAVDDFTIVATTGTPPPSCVSGTITLIHDIQGTGTASPYAGNNTNYTIEGIVVGDFQGTSYQDGFYVMEEAADFDGNSATSEGIFIASNSAVNVGDKVRVNGKVIEYTSGVLSDAGFATMTELSGVALSICTTGNPVTPVDVTLPEATNGDLEHYEGMLVRLNQTLTVSQNYFLGRYGQITLSVAGSATTGRLFHPNNGNGFGDTYALNATRFIVLDDGRIGETNQNPNPVPYLPNPFILGTDTLRAGDTTADVVGVVDNGKINNDGLVDYRLHPTQSVSFTHINLRQATPESVGGTLRVASFNVLNYFNGNGNNNNDGFPTPRGADTYNEFSRQRTKIGQALATLNADIIGIIELENDGTGSVSAVLDLTNAVNGIVGVGTYSYIIEPAPGNDLIKVAILYKASVVTPVGAPLNYQTNAGGYTPLFDRPPLAQRFRQNATNEEFTFVINHFKSKECDGATGLDLDTGEGCFNNKRMVQAQQLYNWVANTLVPNDPDVVLMGDFNAYTEEAPIHTLESAGLRDTGEQFIPADQRYSFVFDGFAGELDHGLTTESLNLQVTDATIWHINADEPSVLDYDQNFNPVGYYSADVYRSSDHDPLLIGLDLRTADYSDSPASYGVAWHRAPHNLWLGTTVDNDTSATVEDDDVADQGIMLYRDRVTAVVSGAVGGQGWLSGWADTNNDGVFGADERIVNQLVSVGNTTIPIAVLPNTSLRTRFRLYESTTEPLIEDVLVATVTGGVNGGEVEDYHMVPLATVLSAFDATVQNDAIQVTWETASEHELVGFDLWRGTIDTTPTEKLNTALIPAQHPGGQGAMYEWQDNAVVTNTTYYYWLDVVDMNGNTTRHGPVMATQTAPTAIMFTTFTVGNMANSWIAMFGVVGLLLMVAFTLRKR